VPFSFTDQGLSAMWMTVAVIASLGLVPGAENSLALTNVRPTYGIMGPPRPDNKVLPGDSYVICFDVEGIQADGNGKVRYSMGMQVADASGKVLFKQVPKDHEADISLGGNSMPAFVTLNVGPDQPPGEYKVTVTVTDRSNGATGSTTTTGEVIPKTFGLVHMNLSSDAMGNFPAPVGIPGQSVWVNFGAVGFTRDKAGRPSLRAELQIVDEDGRPAVAKPFVGEITEAPERAYAVPMQFLLHLNRVGKFMTVVKATDQVSGQSVSVSLPLHVVKGP
jgi:hypothetical protein